MTAGAPSTRRRVLLRYAIGLDLVVVATGVALMLPDRPLIVAAVFVTTIAIAAFMAGWRVGLATTAFSLLVVAIVFTRSAAGMAVVALGGAGVSLAFGRRKPVPHEPRPVARVGLLPDVSPGRVLSLLMYAGLPLLVLIAYTNVSDILIRNFGIPSILQPLILLLAVPLVAYRKDFRPADIAFHPLTLLLAAYCAVIFASSNWAASASLADERLEELLKSLIILIVTASLAATWKALRAALAAVAAGAAALAVLTIVQAVVGDPSLDFGGLASAEEGHLFGEVYRFRAAGPVGDPNVFAQVLLVVIPIALFLAISAKDRDRRMAYYAAGAAITVGMLLTYSRGIMLAFAVVVVLTLVATGIRLTLAKAVIAAVLVLVILPTDFARRFLTIAQLVTDESGMTLDPSVEERRVFAAVALRMFADHPLLGVGAGNYTSHYWPYAYEVGSAAHRYDPLGKREQPHSLYLEIASETGLVGLMVFGGALAVAFLALYRSRSELLRRGETAQAALVTAIAIAIAGYLTSGLFLHAGMQRYLWLIFGFAVAALRLTATPPPAGEAADPVRG